MRAHLFAGAVAVALVGPWAAAAQEQAAHLPLPQLNKCQAKSHPRLPDKWRGVYLMAPFTNAQLVVGEFAHDASIDATRIRLFGVKHGALDLLVQGERTYALASDRSTVAGCEDLGDTGWRPLPPDWLATGSQCAGSASVAETPADWWKTPIEPAPASYWIWYKQSDRTPYRLAFLAPNDRLAALSQFAFSYQVRFDAVGHTDLAAAASACKSAPPAKSGDAKQALRRRIEAMAQAPDRADGDLALAMPELATCPAVPLPRWPEKLAITGLLTPFDFEENPYPTEVLYDWSVPGQRTRIFRPWDRESPHQDALLLAPAGYNVTYFRRRPPMCARVLPGTIRPDWQDRGPCTCEALIAAGTPLSPYGPTRITSCPLNSPRAAWAWTTLSGRPTAFMVTSVPGDEGMGLFAALDYRDWLPGDRVPRAAFSKPARCRAPPGMAQAPDEPSAPGQAPRCTTCHLGDNPR
jgi:hypothetical protein